MITDSHAHLASHRFKDGEVPDLVQRAAEAGVSRIVTLATCLEDLEPNLEIAGRFSGVHACIGIHPCDVHSAPDGAVERIAAHVNDPRVCALGETGLDYFHPAPEGWEEEAFRERQRVFLRAHFELAAKSGLNVVIHTRDKTGDASFQDALAIYKEYAGKTRAVFHCFIGPWENASQVLELDGLVSFGGVATFKNAAEVRETVVACPDGTFMLETDSPYLAPEPHRGQRNEPAYVRQVAERLAALLGKSLADFAAETSATAAGFFRFRGGA
ncbi:TatD family hydrolase [Luteolibacter sp. LG18]|uniref:TatD family hydrolase n=1 Tax=Luteolibacter sp. LG18 TaxID=2819286 RepID=UPI002B317E3B|nr:hydrolase TatD [Luteolibacter sp. LG18]